MIENINKNVLGLIFEFVDPMDWYNYALCSRKCKFDITPFMIHKYKNFVGALTRMKSDWKSRKKVDNGKMLMPCHKAGLIFKFSRYCMRPLKKGLALNTGCQGLVHDGLCASHRMGNRMCIKCKFNEIDPLCFGDYCGSADCKDYMWVLWNGEAVRKKMYECGLKDCNRKTDAQGGRCLICSREVKEGNFLIENTAEDITIRCNAKTTKGTQCKKTTSLKHGKCKMHTFSVDKFTKDM